MSSADRLAHARSVLAQAQNLQAASSADQAPGLGVNTEATQPVLGSRSAAAGRTESTDALKAARSIVLRKLAAGPKTRHQLQVALSAAELPGDCVEQILDRFTELGLIDDAEFADMLIRSKLRSAHHSRRALRQDLAKVGICGETAEEALSAISDTDEEEAARAFVQKKIASMAGYDSHVIERRVIAGLGRRGFPSGLSIAIVREALRERDAPSDCD